MLLEIPDDEPLLAAAGRVAFAHGHLELALARTIKTLTNLSLADADSATRGKKSWELRKRIEELFKQHTKDRVLWTRLDAIMGECVRVSEERNHLIHSVWGRNDDDVLIIHSKSQGQTRAPTAAELNKLAQDIENLVALILNERREGGFIYEVYRAAFPKTEKNEPKR